MDPKSLPKILYIDDTPEARQLVRRLLAQEYLVLEAKDAIGGIELALDTHPDLILVDVNLPELSGREVATRLRTLLPDTPLVALTADTSPGARESALAAGCAGYMTKPFSVDTFREQIKEYLNGKREILADADKYTRISPMMVAQTRLLVPKTLPSSLETESSIARAVIPEANTVK